jgi:hypothetical protein
MAWHVTKQGEYLSSIADQYGFSDYEEIWNHPANADLKSKRQNPNVLLPGDRLFIPEIDIAEYDRPVDLCHKFKLSATILRLRVQLQRAFAPPIASNPCPMKIDDRLFADTATDANGLVEHTIKPSTEQGSLTIKNFVQGIRKEKCADKIVHLKIGCLDPIDSISGQQGRLINLGYYRGSLDANNPLEMRSAVEEFQCDHDLSVDGVCGPNTQAKLEKVYGC